MNMCGRQWPADNPSRSIGLNIYLYLYFLLFLILSSNIILIETASFYGQSYIKLPFRDFNNKTKIEFRFKTHQPNAFLFLAAGSSDYCLIYLEYGQLAIKINFGFGETYLFSDGLRLNDLHWHHVEIEQINLRLLLKIDEKNIFMSKIKNFEENVQLKILYGIYLGSQANFKGLYLGDIKPLRGCLDQIYFNQKNILNLAIKQAIFHEASLDKCDEEFDFGNHYGDANTTIISFVHQDSFVLLPGLQHYYDTSSPSSSMVKNFTTLTVQFDLKSISTNALLLFSPGKNPYKKEYLVVEMIKNRLKASINDGINENHVYSSVSIHDNHWHRIEMVLESDGKLEINIDGRRETSILDVRRKRTTMTTAKPQSSLLLIQRLSNELFLGGVSSERLSLAVNYGIESSLIEQNVSLKGCIKNIRINSRMTSLLDAVATKRIKIGKCKWQFICFDHDKSPCIEQSRCIQIEINRIQCWCQRSDCVKKNYKHKSLDVESMKFINGENCEKQSTEFDVLEGSSTIINNNLLESIKNKFGANHTFDIYLLKKPVYGSIDLDDHFDSDILMSKNIKYTHITPGKYDDTMTLELRKRYKTNSHYHHYYDHDNDQEGCQRYLLKIFFKIHSLNDTPEIQSVHMKILANAKFTLTSNLFKLDLHKETKMKKKKEEIKFKVIRINNGEESFFEKLSNPNIKVEHFSENELKNGSIQFVHRTLGNNESSSDLIEIILNAYHGENFNKPEKEIHLTFKSYNIDKENFINTGLLMAHHTSALISASNLSLLMDENGYDNKDKAQMIRYELMDEPQFGIVQKLRLMPNNWVNVSHFNQRSIERGKIRYLHLSGSPKFDELFIRILFNKQLIRNIKFYVNFVKRLDIVSLGSNNYNFSKNEKEFIISSKEISFQTKPVLSDPRVIWITIHSMPKYGSLFIYQPNTSLQIASQFTQKDIDEKRILYVRNNSFINIDSNRNLFDSFTFNVSINNSNATKISHFHIYFDDTLENNYVLINRKLTVLEGDKSLIDENHLFLRSVDSNRNEDVIFQIIKQPKFGSIQILYDDHIETCPKEIAQKKISRKDVFYIHNDSENNIDFFDFIIRNYTDNNDVITAKFSIEILMKNDNPPMRKRSNKLNIIRNGERMVSNSDICYIDPDLNTGPQNVVFNEIYSSVGYFLFLNGTIAVKFTQQDIDDGLVKFRHNGNDSGKATFSVTDGHFVLSESLDIRASEPYITIVNNTGIIVKYGETCVITSQNLTIETNLPNKNEIFVKLINEPRLGQILINEKSTNHFTLKELEDDYVEYESTIFEDESPFSKNDSFEFRVFSNDHQYKELVSKSHEFIIGIYPLTYFDLDVVNLKNLTLFEESQSLINSKILLVEHSEMKPNKIIYTIIKKPRLGVIKNLNKMEENFIIEESTTSIDQFTQEDINNGYILYQNIKLNENDYFGKEYFDWFEFEVGDEIFKLTQLTFYIELIPKFITLTTENITVNEGSIAILTRKHIHLTHPYYTKYVDEFIVVEEPKYGTISLIGPDDIKLSAKSFSGKELEEEKICYKHESSEFENDWFTIVARANSIEKESMPATIHIHITFINEQAPIIVNISDIEMWKGEMVQITNVSLAAIDEDSKSNEILYLISTPINGYLVNIETNMTVDKFTQAQIDAGKIYFVHVGSRNASFRFHVTDGKNYGSSNILKVKVRTKKINININQKLLVTPGSQQSITNRHLQVSSSDEDGEREFLYRIIKAPIYGRIILEGFKQQRDKIDFFTQQQINENLVFYDQNVSINEPIVLDRIIFNIESTGMPTLKSVHFIIEIGVENFKDIMNTKIDSLVPIEPLIVIEGKFSAISLKEMALEELISKLKYEENKILLRITRQPHHGIVLRNGLILDNFTLFPTSAVRNRTIIYMHDDSNTYNDNIIFSLFTNDNFLIPIMNISLPIRVIPVNDEYPMVINRNPRLRANFASKTLITRDILNTKDNDGNDTKIIYLFRYENISKDGFLSRKDFKELPIYFFTQQDVNDNKIYFVHQGLKIQNFLFWFRIKDDESVICNDEDVPSEINYEHFLTTSIINSHCTPYYPFSITIIRFSIQLVNQTTIQLHQGSWRTLITNSNLAVTNDINDDDTINAIYRIKKGPYNGHISIEDKRSLYFDQQQINQNQVSYVQENMLAKEDSFIVDIFQKENEKVFNNVNIKIIVVPLIKARKPFLSAYPGQKSLLSLDHIDASELSLKTNSNPKFKIFKNPNYGILSLLNFGEENDLSSESISYFTQEDLIQNRIVYFAYSNVEPKNEILIDVVEYEVSALNVQTARGILVINIFSNQSDEMNNVLIKNDYLSYFGMTVVKERFFLFFFLILSVILLIPTIFIIVRICFLSWPKSSNKCPKNYVAQTMSTCHQTDHSSISSTRPNDTLSRYSSSSTTFDHSAVHSDKSPFNKKFENINLKSLKEHSIKKSYNRDMSPLPPPSLYFINDQTFDNHWNKLETSTLELDGDKKQCLIEANQEVVDHSTDNIINDNDNDDDDDDVNFNSRFNETKSCHRKNYEHFPSNQNIILDQTNYSLGNKNIKMTKLDSRFKNQYWI